MFVVASCCFLGACASIGFGGSDLAVDETPTASIGTPTLLAGIDPSDWGILLDSISTLDKDVIAKGAPAMDWDNPATGSKGQITQVKMHKSIMDEECRFFKSSMHRVTGVENIEGEICRGNDGNWQITGFASGTTA